MLRPLLRGLVTDPEKVRAQLFTTMPRVFFAMLPVFAAILALFYRRRRIPTHLVFAARVHAFAFIVLMLAEAVKFTRNDIVQAVVGLAMVLIVLGYGLRALKAVYGDGWVRTVAKAAADWRPHVLVASVPALRDHADVGRNLVVSGRSSCSSDLAVRSAVYARFGAGDVPSASEIAADLAMDVDAVIECYERLAAAHVLVLDPDSREVWMAMPFSAVPTAFRVDGLGRQWFANCAWDAFGIAVALSCDVSIATY